MVVAEPLLSKTKTDFPLGLPVKTEADTQSQEETLHLFAWTNQQLKPILGLPDNWDGYGAVSPTMKQIAEAYVLLFLLKTTFNVDEPVVSPTRTGSICFEWETDLSYLEIDVESLSDGQFLFKHHGSETISGPLFMGNFLGSRHPAFELALKSMFSA